MRKPIKPTIDYLESAVTEAKRRYKALNGRWNRIHDLYFREHQVYHPQMSDGNTPEIIRTPGIEDQIRRATALLTDGAPSVNMVPVSQTLDARKRANLIEAWSNAILPALEKQCGRMVFRNVVHDALLYGVGLLHLEYVPESWVEYRTAQMGDRKGESDESRRLRLTELRRQQKLPFILRDLDPRSVYLFKDEWGIREALIGIRRSRFQVIQDYPGKVKLGEDGFLTMKKLRPSDLGEGTPIEASSGARPGGWGDVDFWTWYSRDTVAYFAEGVLLDTWQHHSGRVPIFEARGLGTSSRQPEYEYRSLIDPIIDLVPTLDSYMTATHHWATRGSYPAFFLESDIDPSNPTLNQGQRGETIPFRPNEITVLDPGDRVRSAQHPPVGDALKDQINLIQQMIRDVTAVPEILKGIAPGADTAGYAVNQLRLEAKMMHQPVLANTATAYEEVIATMLRLVDLVIDDDVPVRAVLPDDEHKRTTKFLDIGPSVIQGYYTVSVSITSAYPQADAFMLRIANELWNSGYFPRKWTYEHLAKIADPEAVDEMLRIEKLENHPKVVQVELENFMQHSGMEGLTKEEQAQIAGDVAGIPPEMLPAPVGMPQGVAGPVPGMPPMPGGPPPGPTIGATGAAAPPLGGLTGAPTIPGTAPLSGGVPIPPGIQVP